MCVVGIHGSLKALSMEFMHSVFYLCYLNYLSTIDLNLLHICLGKRLCIK